MSEISMYEAPYGHIAVKPEIDSNGDAVCDDCAFDDGPNAYQACSDCAGYNRMDEQDVTFKPGE
jgi:hypothetical protein